MASPILLCTDGSDQALGALSAGLDLLGRDHDLLLVTVANGPDEGSLAGSGHAGPELTPAEYDTLLEEADQAARSAIDRTQLELGLGAAEVYILRGDAGPAICRLATERSARAIVIGSRGRGAVRRALLGSVSDHVVRNSSCTVIVTRA